jgi:4-amino-4-deoxy-L-arabinose transferase-like glycosyltransferase
MNEQLRRHLTPSRALLVAILLLAAVLRLSRLDLAEFKADEAGIAREALALVHEGRFPVVGPSSSQGPAHPPLQIYLLALPFAITQDPRLAVAVVALIHAAAVAVTYLLGARFCGRRVGLVAAFLFAVNPWAIYYARKMWTQNWPLATTLFIFCLLLLVVERRPRALVGAAVALVALTGTHLGGVAFIVVLLLVLLLFPTRVQRRPLWLGALILLLFSLPYLYHDATHDWTSLRGFFDLGASQTQLDSQAARFAAWLSSGYHYQDLAGARYSQFLDSLPKLQALDVLEMALLGIGLVYLVARVIRHAAGGRERWREAAGRDVVLLSWLLVPVALQTRHAQPVYPHYFILLYPVQHLVIALLLSDGVDWLGRRLRAPAARWFAWGVLALVLVIGAWNVYVQGAFLRFVGQYDTPEGYGPVIGPTRESAAVAGEAVAGDAEILVVADGDDPVWDNLPAAFDVLLPPHLPRRFVDGQEALVFPQRPAVYLVTPEVREAAATLQAQPGAELIGQIDAPGEQSFWVYRRANDSRDDVLERLTPIAPPRRLANNVEFFAYQVRGEYPLGEPIQLVLIWWLDGPPPTGTDYHSFAHLVDANGERWGQHDFASFPTASWRSGDVVLTRFQIVPDAGTPPGDYWLRLGMYSYPDIVNAPVLDAAGNPVAESVTVGPISLR